MEQSEGEAGGGGQISPLASEGWRRDLTGASPRSLGDGCAGFVVSRRALSFAGSDQSQLRPTSSKCRSRGKAARNRLQDALSIFRSQSTRRSGRGNGARSCNGPGTWRLVAST
jgi:hypothetical protein